MIRAVFHLCGFLLLTASSAQAGQRSVPQGIWGRIQKIVKMNPPFSLPAETLCFPSAESSYGLGLVTNCVYQIRDGKNTLWLMRQDIKTPEHSVENLIGIYVELPDGAKNPKSYYLELDRPRFDQTAVLDSVSYKVPCLMCHASGPRVIRPSADRLKTMSAGQSKLLSDWNQELAGYKIVDNYIPPKNLGKKLVLNEPHMKEPLRLGKCLECHNTETGVRAPLMRMHASTIQYLAVASATEFGHAVMPAYGGSPLNSAEMKCLQEWIEGHHLDGCFMASEENVGIQKKITAVARRSSELLSIDAGASDLTARVHTTFHDFDVKHLEVSGSSKKKTADRVSAEVDIHLESLDAGISARSQHTKDWLDTVQFPVVHIAGDIVRRGTVVSMHQAQLTLKGITRSVNLSLKCDRVLRVCALAPIAIDLSAWGLVPPGFLGIKVSPSIEITGTIFLNAVEISDVAGGSESFAHGVKPLEAVVTK